ncbi:hypothetical protein QYE76_007232 [Lolium multiflorum]|uniref:Reverse transcriptase Ty1/copia-type domain-containing protein n=1 Tax=Lolium multiflorum TaxID=4521 RepID=A0AAD8RXU8_LOLMU|nr:hypothetical protein QYE76_007232 [Lolium multiflorum]
MRVGRHLQAQPNVVCTRGRFSAASLRPHCTARAATDPTLLYGPHANRTWEEFSGKWIFRHKTPHRRWPVHPLDVKNAFLHGTRLEEVYCLQPVGFVDPAKPDHVWRLSKRPAHGFSVSPASSPVTTIGFTATYSDSSLFKYAAHGSDAAFLLRTWMPSSSQRRATPVLLQRIVTRPSRISIGALHYFLGIHVTRTAAGFFLSQKQYARARRTS